MSNVEDDFADGAAAAAEAEAQQKKTNSKDSDRSKHTRFDNNDGRDGNAASTATTNNDADDTRIRTEPARSVEGWIVIVRNLHDEVQEEDLHDKFSEFGEIKNLQLPLDRRTGFVKGYALVEFGKRAEAQAAISDIDGSTFMEKSLAVEWAFVQ